MSKLKYYIVFLTIIINSLYSSNNMYGYIDPSGGQLSIEFEEKFNLDYNHLLKIEKKILSGDFLNAIDDAKKLQRSTNSNLIKSKATILLFRALLKKDKVREILKKYSHFKEAINTGKIAEPDLVEAYTLYMDYLIRLRKFDEAIGYATQIIKMEGYPTYRDNGYIYLAKVYLAKGDESQAQFVLNKVLRKTQSIKAASQAASVQFDIFIKNKKFKQAKDVIKNIFKHNMKYFIVNTNIATKKINALIKHEMFQEVLEINQSLLNESTNEKLKAQYLYNIAISQFFLGDIANAKESFITILHDYKKSKFFKKAQAGVDEILLREGQLKPESLTEKYKDSPIMQQKILLNELLNLKKEEKYNLILNQIKAYKKISNSIVKPYGYSNIDDIVEETRVLLAKMYLKNDQCIEFADFLTNNPNILEDIIEGDIDTQRILTCVSKSNSKEVFKYIHNKYKYSTDPYVLYLLEQSAMNTKEWDTALLLSFKVEKHGTKEIKQKEVFDRFFIINNLELLNSKNDFFTYITQNRWLIESSKDPRVLDVLYQYYQFLVKRNMPLKENILNLLHSRQQELNIFVYSPFVELEVATKQFNKELYKEALETLSNVKLNKLTKEDKVHRYYFLLSKIYTKLNMPVETIHSIDKCLNQSGDSMWKNLCNKVDKTIER